MRTESDKKFIELRRRCETIAKRKGYPNEAEDFAQYAAEKWLLGRRTTVDQLFTDYLRQNYGDFRSPGGRDRAIGRHTQKAIDDNIQYSGSNFRDSPDSRTYVRSGTQYLKEESRIDQACYMLFHMWGFLETEIGNLFGFSGSRVCQRIKRVQSGLSARIAKEKSEVCREGKRIVEAVREEKGEEMEFRADKEMARREFGALAIAYETRFDEWLT
jgi:hypothetical protein